MRDRLAPLDQLAVSAREPRYPRDGRGGDLGDLRHDLPFVRARLRPVMFPLPRPRRGDQTRVRSAILNRSVESGVGAESASRNARARAAPAAVNASRPCCRTMPSHSPGHVRRPFSTGPAHHTQVAAGLDTDVCRWGFVGDRRPSVRFRPEIGVAIDRAPPPSSSRRATSSATRPTKAPHPTAESANSRTRGGVTRHTPRRVSKKSSAANRRRARRSKT